MNMNNIIFISYLLKKRPTFSKKWLLNIVSSIIGYLKLTSKVEVGIVITDNHNIQRLNRIYRYLDEPTDVLSFYMYSSIYINKETDFILPPDGTIHLGEVIISYEKALLQARQHKVKVKDELIKLLIHGILHLLNYDHENETDSKIMLESEREIISYITKKEIGSL